MVPRGDQPIGALTSPMALFYLGACVVFLAGVCAVIVAPKSAPPEARVLMDTSPVIERPHDQFGGDAVVPRQRRRATMEGFGAAVYLGTLTGRLLHGGATGIPVALVSGVAGELEGCNCSGPAARGGLLQNLWIVDRLRRDIAGLSVVDGGGNLEKPGGLFGVGDAPPSFVDALGRFDFSGSYDGDALALRNSEYLLGAIPTSSRGESLLLLLLPESGPSPPAAGVQPLTDASSDLRRSIVRATLGIGAPGPVPSLGADEFFVETIPVTGRNWTTSPELSGTRTLILEEFIESLALPSTSGRDSDACATCHAAQAQAWEENATHSAAWDALSAVSYATRNAFCVPCHSQGLGQDQLLASPVTVPEANRNVGCISCHGHGDVGEGCSRVVSAPTIETCRRCHTDGRRGSLGRAEAGALRQFVGCAQAD